MDTQAIIGAVGRKLKKLSGGKVGRAVAKVPAPIRRGWLAGALVPVPGAAETGALIGAAVHGKRVLEDVIRRRTGAPYRLFETPARRLLEFMGYYGGGDPGEGSLVSEKLDGVYARATKDGVYSKSGKPLDVPHVDKRLRRFFRKHPDGALEGELWRKGEGVEKIAGAVKSGGQAAKRLRLHLYPGQDDVPLPIGAVRRVKGHKAATEADVERILAKVVKRGGEGVVVRKADGTALKKKPREDAEWEVAAAPDGKRGVLVLKDGDATFKVQSRAGLKAAAGDRVQVSYSGRTAKGRPKAAVAERVRNDTDFETQDRETQDARTYMKTTRFETPAMKILAGDPCARVLFGRGMTPEEEIEHDRRKLKRIAIGALAAGMGAGLLLRKGKRIPGKGPVAVVRPAPAVKAAPAVPAPVVAAPAAVVPKVTRTKRTQRGVPVLAATGKGRVALETPATRMGIEFAEDRRDGLAKARDVAIIGGTGALGTGALVAAHQARKVGREAVLAAQKLREVTPEAVARESGRLVKRKLKQKVADYFPTFTRWGRKAAGVLKKTFETPAERMGVIEFAGAAGYKLRDDDRRWVDHVDVAWGKKRGYDADGNEVKVGVGDPAVMKSYLKKAGEINKWGGRGTRIVKDASDVVRGVPRERDASGRKKKREWEKPWAENTAKKALLAGGLAAYGIGYKKYQPLRVAHKQVVRKMKKGVRNIQRALADFEGKDQVSSFKFQAQEFVTPAQRMGIEFAGGRLIKAAEQAAGDMLEVFHRKTGEVVWRGSAAKRKIARRVMDRRDNAYGGYIHGMRTVGANGKVSFSTPAQRLGIEFATKTRKPEGDPDAAARAAIGGAVVGGLNGGVLGGLSTAVSREADDYFDLKNRKPSGAGQGGVMVAAKEAAPFKARGKFGKTERLARAQWQAGSKLRKAVRRRTLGGALAGAALLGGGGYITRKMTDGKDKRFSTPADRLGISFDAVAADAGWDIRDPRGKSARVFAPGARKRVRREKQWHEEVQNERKLWKTGTAAALLAGGAAGLLIGKRLPKKPRVGAALGPLPKVR